MNIKDFLIDNYIWILAIILITIITIIGFLADKKKGTKTKEKEVSAPINNNAPLSFEQQMQYNAGVNQYQQNQFNNMGIPQNNLNNINNINMQPIQMNNQQPMTQPQPIEPIPNVINPINNNPQMVENIASSPNPESMYQPLSEQPQNFNQPMTNFNNIQVNPTPVPNVETVEPTIPTPIPNMMDNSYINQQQLSNPTIINNGMNSQLQPSFGINQPISTNDINNQTSNFGMNASTIPSPVDYSQPIIPQPVSPQMIMQQENFNQQNVPESIPNGMNNISNNSQMPIQNQNIQNNGVNQQPQNFNQPQQPVSFVYGPSNNNQNM